MYRYDEVDQRLVDERVAQFRDQTRRYYAGELSDDEFRPLRLQNGLYMQRHGPMLRIAVPYGLLSSRQLRQLAYIARRYDRGSGHLTTRQNIQFNWLQMAEMPDLLADLAAVEMHAIQTSGNCIRNITSDQYAGVAPDELEDPRPWCEILRQWSSFHPEFAYLPRKFKIAVNAASTDRAVVAVHDIGLHLVHDAAGATGFTVLVGGGLGRTAIIGPVVREFLPAKHLLSYCEAILRVYNRYGRRDNMYKARIKILVKSLGVAEFTRLVEAEWAHLENGPETLSEAEIARVAGHFTPPAYEALPSGNELLESQKSDKAFARWLERNVAGHKKPGYAAVNLSLKAPGLAPGDISAEQMESVAELADLYSFGELRVSHEQNLILADVKESDLHALWGRAKAAGLATPTIGLLNDIICCPGGDYCSLANAKSIPVAKAVADRFDDLDYLFDIGDISLNISGCMNGCAHHLVGNIGVLGVDKHGEEWYQVSIGGTQGRDASLGDVIGPSFSGADIPEVVQRLLTVYVEQRHADESFIDTLRRIGLDPFKAGVYSGTEEERKFKYA